MDIVGDFYSLYMVVERKYYGLIAVYERMAVSGVMFNQPNKRAYIPVQKVEYILLYDFLDTDKFYQVGMGGRPLAGASIIQRYDLSSL
ncbi:hypothetical protein [Zymobacter sp. IVIA_12111.31 C1]|uniref:hypothetical protein n=1 Tax=Zymobacter sp. IVIA_12111.31 C1 TaxID=3394854 RepID=UPI0039C3F2C5